MVNPEKHKTAASESDDIKPIKSTISVDFNDESDVDYFALCGVQSYEIKTYVADNFKKEITDLDVLNLAMMLLCDIVTVETDDEKANIISDLTDIVTNKYKLNEFIFTRLATIKSWNETTAKLNAKYGNKEKMRDKVTEKEFDELMNANNEKNQYKAWNDERRVLDMYSAKGDSDGGNN